MKKWRMKIRNKSTISCNGIVSKSVEAINPELDYGLDSTFYNVFLLGGNKENMSNLFLTCI